MNEVRNLNNKRVADISEDRRFLVIVEKGYVTHITANPDGTLNITHDRIGLAA